MSLILKGGNTFHFDFRILMSDMVIKRVHHISYIHVYGSN